ncbi:hypothetical protein E2C01_087402 [Portunus trituberculatus]|uniref:Uncharacterized protein n=1 Tax=Portunus trituberculatus TaxID=210409 RepID=A0A5B7J383_PORTR|nr:hypothetical protein [Portunus trituberculatus]
MVPLGQALQRLKRYRREMDIHYMGHFGQIRMIPITSFI